MFKPIDSIITEINDGIEQTRRDRNTGRNLMKQVRQTEVGEKT